MTDGFDEEKPQTLAFTASDVRKPDGKCSNAAARAAISSSQEKAPNVPFVASCCVTWLFNHSVNR